MRAHAPLAWDFATLRKNTNTCPYPVPVLDADGKETGKMRDCGLPCANPRNVNSKACVRHQIAWPRHQSRVQQQLKRARDLAQPGVVA
jgi:hypothetical protein